MSEDTKQKLREANLGKKASDETRQKMSQTGIARYENDPSLAKNLSDRMRGMKYSEDMRRKLSEVRKQKILSGEIKINRDKISETMTQKYMNDGFRWAKGTYVSTKTLKSCTYRSSYELQYMELLDADDDVIDWKFEPFALKYEIDGVTRRYIPDFLVTRKTCKELVEVKPRCLRDTKMNSLKRQAAQRYCSDNDVAYVEWTSDVDSSQNENSPGSDITRSPVDGLTMTFLP